MVRQYNFIDFDGMTYSSLRRDMHLKLKTGNNTSQKLYYWPSSSIVFMRQRSIHCRTEFWHNKIFARSMITVSSHIGRQTAAYSSWNEIYFSPNLFFRSKSRNIFCCHWFSNPIKNDEEIWSVIYNCWPRSHLEFFK